jgi:hypothetical protein
MAFTPMHLISVDGPGPEPLEGCIRIKSMFEFAYCGGLFPIIRLRVRTEHLTMESNMGDAENVR